MVNSSEQLLLYKFSKISKKYILRKEYKMVSKAIHSLKFVSENKIICVSRNGRLCLLELDEVHGNMSVVSNITLLSGKFHIFLLF